MGRAWEQHEEVEIDATPEQIWHAIATGPGIDSWFIGRSQVEPGEGSSMTTDMGPVTMHSTVTAWEPLKHFAYRSDQGEDGRFFAQEYFIEGRDQGSTVMRLVTNGFLPGDNWEAEYDALRKGGEMYFRTLLAYLTYFPGQTSTSVAAAGPPVSDWDRAWMAVGRALGLAGQPTLGARVQFTPQGLMPNGGVVDFVNSNAIGVRTQDALYRFIRGFHGSMLTGHHLFGPADQERAAHEWQAWLTQLFTDNPC